MNSLVQKCCSRVSSLLLFIGLIAGCGGGGGGVEGGDGPTGYAYQEFTYSGDIRVDSLLTPPESQLNWNFVAPGRALNYTFDISLVSFSKSSASAFTVAERTAALAILEHVTAVTGIQFIETSDAQVADIHFAVAAGPGFGHMTWMGRGSRPAAYVILNTIFYRGDHAMRSADGLGYRSMLPGTLAYETLLHEVGHAIGLKHPQDRPGIQLPSDQDKKSNTIMTPYAVSNGTPDLPFTFQPYDLMALWWMYGGDGLGGSRGFNSALGPSLKE